jgi:hypothetical protein
MLRTAQVSAFGDCCVCVVWITSPKRFSEKATQKGKRHAKDRSQYTKDRGQYTIDVCLGAIPMTIGALKIIFMLLYDKCAFCGQIYIMVNAHPYFLGIQN